MRGGPLRSLVVCVVVLAPSLVASFDFLKPKYWKDQALTAKLLSGVPKGSKVLEIDCVDGAKNLYYLPLGCDVRQWYGTPPKDADKGPVQLAAQKLGLSIEVVLARNEGKPPRLETESFDVCFGVRALERAYLRGGEEAALVVLDAVLEACKPSGRFYFLEDKGSDGLLAALLDEHPLVESCEAAVENDSIAGYVTRKRPEPTRGMGPTTPSAPKPKKKKKSRSPRGF